MDTNEFLEPVTGFGKLSQEELLDTCGGRFLSWGATSGFVFLTSLVKDLLKKDEEK